MLTALILLFGLCGPVAAAESGEFPHLLRVLTLQDPNTRTVLVGTVLLGISGGIVGVFMLLRKQSLIADVIGHSALPGIAIAFIISQLVLSESQQDMRQIVPRYLVPGAFLAGLLGALCALAIDRHSRLKADAALAIVLSLFYGLGTALLTAIQRFPTANAAGLQSLLEGKTATMVDNDVRSFAVATAVLCTITLVLSKELTLLCFDDEFAAASGWPTFWLDALLLGLVVGVTVLGMQTVGLILVVAILVIPAASARFWTDNVRRLLWTSALLGGLAAAGGTIVSALAPRLAAGAVIVLCGSALFVISLFLGSRRGLLWRWREHVALQRRIGQNDLLRASYELIESREPDDDIPERRLIEAKFTRGDLQPLRSWSPVRLGSLIGQALRSEFLSLSAGGQYRLTAEGAALARRAVRNHRLWEMYLITFADVAPGQVDRDADRIEHILGPEMIRELERRLVAEDDRALPASPHALPPVPPNESLLLSGNKEPRDTQTDSAS